MSESNKHQEAARELPLPKSEIEISGPIEGDKLWEYLSAERPELDFGQVQKNEELTGDDWMVVLKDAEGLESRHIYSAAHYDKEFIDKIVGFASTPSKFSPDGSLPTLEQVTKKIEEILATKKT